MLIKRMKTSTPEGRDRSAMGKGGGEGKGIHMHTHTQTKERRGEGHTPHSPFRTRPTTHSLPYSRSEVSYCEKRNVLRELRKEEIEFVSLMFLGKAFHRMVAI